MRVAVFGLGEAGALFAADLAATGAEVLGYDPADVVTPAGVHRCDNPASAVAGVDLVLALTSADDAPGALAQALGHVEAGVLYADLGTGSAGLKLRMAATAAEHGLVFADVALMTMVPGKGLRTPALVSGPGAERYSAMLEPLGVPVESLGGEPGLAATRKLLRSVMMKGLAALVIESMLAGEAAGQAEWLWGNLVDEISAAGEPWLSRLVRGTQPHATRRLHEMEASAELLADLGVEPVMTRATVETLRRRSHGHEPMPAIRPVPD
jgi:3-hydroxyisobutyrate dehydrogenase-like beta-hydroxyacid dehydrogenase